MRKLIVLFAALMLLISCEKDSDNGDGPPEVQVKVTDYFPMTVGSYWVYETYKIDSLGNEERVGRVDSISIVGDTLIRGEKYYHFNGTSFGNGKPYDRFFKDSLGFIVDSKGQKELAMNFYTDTLLYHIAVLNEDTLFTLNYVMDQRMDLINVPAGNFKALKKLCDVTFYIGYNIPIKKPMPSFYAINVGKVSYISYYSAIARMGISFETRLLRYHINETDIE